MAQNWGENKMRRSQRSCLSPTSIRLGGLLELVQELCGEVRENVPVIIVSQRAAQRFLPGKSLIGRRLRIGAPADDKELYTGSATVVGVAKRAHLPGLLLATGDQEDRLICCTRTCPVGSAKPPAGR